MSAHESNSAVAQPLLVLMDLARRARRAETAQALQFLLVNQTTALVRYVVGVLWTQDDGVLLQSGVSHVERNAPFVQWLNEVADQLADQTKISVVTPDMMTPEQRIAWSEMLPPQAVWVPLSLGDRKGGVLLCRDLIFTEHELALLNEWMDIWTHAWVKLAAPTVHGELTRLWHRLSDHLPSSGQIKGALGDFWLGCRTTIQRLQDNPVVAWHWLKSIHSRAMAALKRRAAWLKSQGVEGTRHAIVLEAQAIWANKRRRWKWIIWILILFPVRLTVLAPGELVPANPAIIRVPIEGVVDEFFVSPNDKVTVGQPLFKLDLTSLLSKAQVAQQEIQVATQEYRQSALQSLTDAKSRGQLASQEGKAAERKIEADYSQAMLEKATIESPRDGVVIFDDPTEWIGKPVAAGEKVMVVATEGQVEIEAWIPVGDMLDVPKSASVTLYLNAKPFSPVSGYMRYVGHEPMARPDGSYAYRLRASLPAGEVGPRVGLKGTAKISGQYVPLSYWVLRKPLAVVRQFLGI